MCKRIKINATNDELIQAYFELNSSYRVAEKFNTSTTAVKRVLGELGVLRNQSEAASLRNITCPSKSRGHKKSLRMRERLKLSIANSEKCKHRIKHSKSKRLDQRRKEEYDLIQIKKELLVDSNYCCKNCKSNSTTTNRLIVHHIIPYSFLPEGHLDKENMIILCRKCHLTYGHLNNWKKFNVNLVTKTLMNKYNIYAERLNEMAGDYPDAIVRSVAINETTELDRNDQVVVKKQQ